MPLTKVVQRRGSRVVIEAYGEVLMTPAGNVGVWMATLSRAITAATKRAAPSNSRPYWGHYAGHKRLAESITSSTEYNPALMQVNSVVGSSAPYALFVDQGTGVYAGHQPYEAAILPPWTRGDASLYEATWRPGGVGTSKASPVMIRGQRAQKFFQKGIKFGMLSMGVVPHTKPMDPAASLKNSTPSNLPGAAPPQMSLFRLQLEEWRIWRDTAWGEGRMLGRDGGGSSNYARRMTAAKRSKAQKASRKTTRKPPAKKTAKPKATQKPAPKKPPAKKGLTTEQKREIARAIGARWKQAGREFRALEIRNDGTWKALIKKGSIFKPETGRWRT